MCIRDSYPEDRSRMEEIKQTDPAAVVVNGYYSGYLGEDMSLDELTAGVRRHYENGYTSKLRVTTALRGLVVGFASVVKVT